MAENKHTHCIQYEHYPHNHAQSREIIKWQQRIIDEKYKKKLKLIKFDDNIEIYGQFDVSSRHLLRIFLIKIPKPIIW